MSVLTSLQLHRKLFKVSQPCLGYCRSAWVTWYNASSQYPDWIQRLKPNMLALSRPKIPFGGWSPSATAADRRKLIIPRHHLHDERFLPNVCLQIHNAEYLGNRPNDVGERWRTSRDCFGNCCLTFNLKWLILGILFYLF